MWVGVHVGAEEESHAVHNSEYVLWHVLRLWLSFCVFSLRHCVWPADAFIHCVLRLVLRFVLCLSYDVSLCCCIFCLVTCDPILFCSSTLNVVEPDGAIGNPPQGTIVDQDFGIHGYSNFYLVSSKSIYTTVKPVHYIIIHDDKKIPIPELQSLTFAMCHCYPNWPGLVCFLTQLISCRCHQGAVSDATGAQVGVSTGRVTNWLSRNQPWVAIHLLLFVVLITVVRLPVT